MWYTLNQPESIYSPALLLYKDRVQANIDLMIQLAGGAERLIPHVKTHKMAEVIGMQLAAGITKFKCATIAEAELLAQSGARRVLLAYQLVGPNLSRFQALQAHYPEVSFASLVDSLDSAKRLNDFARQNGYRARVFLDVNNGMNRSGHPVNEALFDLYLQLYRLPHLQVEGLHIYDGHIRDSAFEVRKQRSDTAFGFVDTLLDTLQKNGLPRPMLIAGGSPSFTVHTLREGVYCSPGTCVLWDWGYGDLLPDQPFLHAALLMTRIISKPTEGIVTIDLGHKAVAAENPIDKRIRILNLTDYELLSQSEEHGVLRVDQWDQLAVGDVLYAVPYHICPTVALHEYAHVIENGSLIGRWHIAARKRQLTF